MILLTNQQSVESYLTILGCLNARKNQFDYWKCCCCLGENEGGIQLELKLETSGLTKSVDYEMIPSKFDASVSMRAHGKEINLVSDLKIDWLDVNEEVDAQIAVMGFGANPGIVMTVVMNGTSRVG